MSNLPEHPHERSKTYMVGIGVTHTISPPMHAFVQSSLGLPWTFTPTECPTIEDAMQLFRRPDFAGGVVTMPYKQSIMQHLDGLDDLALQLGACNCVYRAGDDGKELRGTNTDWCGVFGCLLSQSERGKGKPAMVIGAGGASRAAVYALAECLGCKVIYVVNRDKVEVDGLVRDVARLRSKPEVRHVASLDVAADLEAPFYVVGTVPDFEPILAEEKECQAILEHFLSKAEEKGVLLDMCYKPRKTRILKLGMKHRWQVVEGTEVVGLQAQEQYRVWIGDDVVNNSIMEGASKVLAKTADASTAINF